MKKAFWLLLLATLLACGPTTVDPSVNTNTDEEVEEETAVSNTEDAAEAEANDESAETTAPVLAAATNFDSFSPTSTVEEAAIVREQDWRKGAAEPAVVIIEYGDFQ